jgi:hypothetical protein
MRSWRAPLTPTEARWMPVALLVLVVVWAVSMVVLLVAVFR